MYRSPIAMPVRGVDLLSPDTAIPRGYARRVENVVIGRDGTITRRAGRQLLVEGGGFHSIEQTAHGLLVGRGVGLYRITDDPQHPEPLTHLGAASLIDFTDYNGHTYLTNGTGVWWIPSDEDAPRPCGVSLPSTLPTISVADTGALPAGTYSVALSLVDDRGEESRAVMLGQVTLPVSGGIRLNGLEVDLSSRYRVFLTPPDGDVLYLSEEFSGAFSQYLVSRPADGAMRRTQHLQPIPAGQFIRGRNGRLYVAKDNILWFSQALRPHLIDPRHDYIQFVGQIRFIEPLSIGLLVADDRGVWLLEGDDPSNARMRQVSVAKAVTGSSKRIPSGTVLRADDVAASVLWLSEEGYIIASDLGEVRALNSGQVRVPTDQRGRTVVVKRDGAVQILTLVAATEIYGDSIATIHTGG